MRLILLNSSIRHHADVIMDIKIEQGSRFATGFVDNEVVECIVLWED